MGEGRVEIGVEAASRISNVDNVSKNQVDYVFEKVSIIWEPGSHTFLY